MVLPKSPFLKAGCLGSKMAKEQVQLASHDEEEDHPGLSEIPAPDGSQEVMSQIEDYPIWQ